nr:lipocalin family protein [Octadecabacter sp.]
PPQPVEVFRDRSAQIASQTDVTAARMAGDWAIRQRFAAPRTPLSGMTLAALPNGALQMSVLAGECVDDVCSEEEILILLEKTGPGRWTVRGPQAHLPSNELWVMWMEFDSRTAAIGTPSGEFGWIMDKNLRGGGDRITAARDIMDWFGYDVSRLEEVNR